MSTAVQKKSDPLELMLEQGKKQIERALPAIVKSDRFIRTVLTEVRKSHALQKCSPVSVCAAVMQAAQLGLEFGSQLGHVYLVPYKDEATLQVGYRGLMELVRRSGFVRTFSASCVYEGDIFDWEQGTKPFIRHKPCGVQKNLLFVYAVATFPNDQFQFDVMSRAAVEEVRDKFSRAKNADAWTKSFDEMAKKTVVRRLIKMLPISTEVSEALSTEDDFETIEVERKPELAARVAESQMQLSSKESEAAHDEVERLFVECEKLKINTDDLPIEDYTDQQAVAICEILRERIKGWKSINESKS